MAVDCNIAVVRSAANIEHPGRPGHNAHWGGWGFYAAEQAMEILGVSVSFLTDDDLADAGRLGRHRVVVCPEMPIVSPRQREAIGRYVQAGGVFITDGAFSLYKDEALGPWWRERTGYRDELLGIEVVGSQVSEHFDAGEPAIVGVITHPLEEELLLRRIPWRLPVFGRTLIVRPAPGARGIGAFEARRLPDFEGDETTGSLCVVRNLEKGLTIYLAPRVFRTLGLLLSGSSSPDNWVSRTEFYPSADATGGIHAYWEHNAIYQALRAGGWAGIPIAEYYLRLVANLLDLADAHTGIPTARVWFWPDAKPFAYVPTFHVDQVGDRTRWYKRHRTARDDLLPIFQKCVALDKELGLYPNVTYFFEARPEAVPTYPNARALANYRIEDEGIRECIAMLRGEGYEVGLHNCHWAARELAEEVRLFREAVGEVPSGTCGHYVVGGPQTPRWLQEMGVKWDASFITQQGFETVNGLYHPMRPFDAAAKCSLEIVEVPCFYTEWMQRSLGYGGLMPPLTFERLAGAVEMIRMLGGVWLSGFHAGGAYANALGFEEKLYRFIATACARKGALIATGGKVAAWWTARRHVRAASALDGERLTLGVAHDGSSEAGALRGVTVAARLPAGTEVQAVTVDGSPWQKFRVEREESCARVLVALDHLGDGRQVEIELVCAEEPLAKTQ